MLKDITPQAFESIIGEHVELEAGENRFRATVEEVNLLRRHAKRAQQPFSVILLAEDAADFGQRVYRVSHHTLGVLDLFAVPIGPGTNGMRYEIVFN